MRFSDKVNKRIKIAFVGDISSSFIKHDYEILKEYFDVYIFQLPRKKIDWIKYIFILAKEVKQYDLTFSWFAGWHSALAVFFSKLFRKKSVVVVGGFDAAYVPEINYGAFTNLKEKIPSKYVLKNADLVLPVSNFVKKEILDKTKPKQVEVVYNCVNDRKFKPVEKKENIIVTIGRVTKQGIKLKGLETFAKASTYFPDYKFVIIGEIEKNAVNQLQRNNPKLVFTGKITHDEVLKWLQQAKIYCQLSYMESFGVGVAEGMSCGCIPIVTDRGGLPEVIGDTGFFVSYGDEKATVEMIKKALTLDDDPGGKARERIKKMFSYKKRREELEKIILGMIS